MSTPSHDDDASSDFSPVASRAVLTPRGGFMARPGLKTPPRHAVVVRGGNAEVSAEIPVARSSCPPPAPVHQRPSDPAPVASCDKVTLPAIPRLPNVELPERQTPKLDTLLPPPPDSAPAAWAPRSVGSVPPPSDAPVATSLREPSPSSPPARRRSGWTVVLAAAIGLVVGLVSIATTMGRTRTAAQQSTATPLSAAEVSPELSAARASEAAETPVTSAGLPPEPLPPPSAARAPAQPPGPTGLPRKKSIF